MKTENKRENKMPNFTEWDLEHCLQKQVSCVCNYKSPCTGQRSKIKVLTLTVLVGSLYCQTACARAHFTSSVCVSVSLIGQRPKLNKSRRFCFKTIILISTSALLKTHMLLACLNISGGNWEGATIDLNL